MTQADYHQDQEFLITAQPHHPKCHSPHNPANTPHIINNKTNQTSLKKMTISANSIPSTIIIIDKNNNNKYHKQLIAIYNNLNQ